MTSFVRWALAFCLLLCVATPVLSQSRNTGEIRGTVTAGGAVLPGTTVTVDQTKVTTEHSPRPPR